MTLVTYFKAKDGDPMTGKALMLDLLSFSCKSISLSHVGMSQVASEPP